MTRTLLLIDIQNDYFKCGEMKLEGIEKAAENGNKVLEIFRKKSLPVVHIHISTRLNADFFLPGTNGANINENL